LRDFVRNRLKTKFEQAYFQRQRFLHIGVQQPLGLLQRLQILQCLPRGNAPGDGFRTGNLREFQQASAGGERAPVLRSSATAEDGQNLAFVSTACPVAARQERRLFKMRD